MSNLNSCSSAPRKSVCSGKKDPSRLRCVLGPLGFGELFNSSVAAGKATDKCRGAYYPDVVRTFFRASASILASAERHPPWVVSGLDIEHFHCSCGHLESRLPSLSHADQADRSMQGSRGTMDELQTSERNRLASHDSSCVE